MQTPIPDRHRRHQTDEIRAVALPLRQQNQTLLPAARPLLKKLLLPFCLPF